jgi:signal transduction histidine kinase
MLLLGAPGLHSTTAGRVSQMPHQGWDAAFSRVQAQYQNEPRGLATEGHAMHRRDAMFHPSASFRTVVGTVVAVVGALALATAAALVFLTTELRRTTDDLRAVIESVRLADDAAIDLLLHARVDDVLARREVERDLREKLDRAEAFAHSDVQREVLAVARERVSAYLATPDARDAGSLDGAFEALEALVAANVRESHEADARARRLDRMGDAIGFGTAAAFALVAGWLLWWLRSRAFQPLLTLAEAMKRFGTGEAAARAPEEGPAELRAMARRFNEMAAALAALRERQLAFVASLAHDLRNPVSALKLATSRPAGGDGTEVNEGRLNLVRRQVLRIEGLVTDFIDTARLEAGRMDIHPEPVDLRPIVENVVSLYRATSAAHRIRARLPEGQIIASCDPGRFEQVLNNLVSNAIKYSPNGGHVEVLVEPRPDAVAVSVADEGVGIPHDESHAIFEPFRRGRTVQRDIPGAGLGLYLSKRIVEAHGGHLRVTSSPGRGSTFEVVLPR